MPGTSGFLEEVGATDLAPGACSSFHSQVASGQWVRRPPPTVKDHSARDLVRCQEGSFDRRSTSPKKSEASGNSVLLLMGFSARSGP